jgi:hypothetical protein
LPLELYERLALFLLRCHSIPKILLIERDGSVPAVTLAPDQRGGPRAPAGVSSLRQAPAVRGPVFSVNWGLPEWHSVKSVRKK